MYYQLGKLYSVTHHITTSLTLAHLARRVAVGVIFFGLKLVRLISKASWQIVWWMLFMSSVKPKFNGDLFEITS